MKTLIPSATILLFLLSGFTEALSNIIEKRIVIILSMIFLITSHITGIICIFFLKEEDIFSWIFLCILIWCYLWVMIFARNQEFKNK